MEPTTAIERRSNLTREEFIEQYLVPRKPVLLTDALNGQALLQKWTLDYFKQRYGSLKANILAFQPGFTRPARLDMTVGEYIEALQQNTWQKDWPAGYPAPYLERWMEFDPLWGTRAAEIASEYQTPSYFKDSSHVLPKFLRLGISLHLFIGPAGTIVWPHYDSYMTHAWSCNVTGRKRWLLYSPDQAALLYDNNGRSPVHAEEPDFDRFPLFRQARAIEAVNGPGETVFVPSGWFHYVRSLEPTISISGNFINGNMGTYLSDLASTAVRLAGLEIRKRLLGGSPEASQ